MDIWKAPTPNSVISFKIAPRENSDKVRPTLMVPKLPSTLKNTSRISMASPFLFWPEALPLDEAGAKLICAVPVRPFAEGLTTFMVWNAGNKPSFKCELLPALTSSWSNWL